MSKLLLNYSISESIAELIRNAQSSISIQQYKFDPTSDESRDMLLALHNLGVKCMRENRTVKVKFAVDHRVFPASVLYAASHAFGLEQVVNLQNLYPKLQITVAKIQNAFRGTLHAKGIAIDQKIAIVRSGEGSRVNGREGEQRESAVLLIDSEHARAIEERVNTLTKSDQARIVRPSSAIAPSKYVDMPIVMLPASSTTLPGDKTKSLLELHECFEQLDGIQDISVDNIKDKKIINDRFSKQQHILERLRIKLKKSLEDIANDSHKICAFLYLCKNTIDKFSAKLHWLDFQLKHQQKMHKAKYKLLATHQGLLQSILDKYKDAIVAESDQGQTQENTSRNTHKQSQTPQEEYQLACKALNNFASTFTTVTLGKSKLDQILYLTELDYHFLHVENAINAIKIHGESFPDQPLTEDNYTKLMDHLENIDQNAYQQYENRYDSIESFIKEHGLIDNDLERIDGSNFLANKDKLLQKEPYKLSKYKQTVLEQIKLQENGARIRIAISNLNDPDIISELANACNRGVVVSIALGKYMNYRSEIYSGGSNDYVMHKLFSLVASENRKNLHIRWLLFNKDGRNILGKKLLSKGTHRKYVSFESATERCYLLGSSPMDVQATYSEELDVMASSEEDVRKADAELFYHEFRAGIDFHFEKAIELLKQSGYSKYAEAIYQGYLYTDRQHDQELARKTIVTEMKDFIVVELAKSLAAGKRRSLSDCRNHLVNLEYLPEWQTIPKESPKNEGSNVEQLAARQLEIIECAIKNYKANKATGNQRYLSLLSSSTEGIKDLQPDGIMQKVCQLINEQTGCYGRFHKNSFAIQLAQFGFFDQILKIYGIVDIDAFKKKLSDGTRSHNLLFRNHADSYCARNQLLDVIRMHYNRLKHHRSLTISSFNGRGIPLTV